MFTNWRGNVSVKYEAGEMKVAQKIKWEIAAEMWAP